MALNLATSSSFIEDPTVDDVLCDAVEEIRKSARRLPKRSLTKRDFMVINCHRSLCVIYSVGNYLPAAVTAHKTAGPHSKGERIDKKPVEKSNP